MNHENPILKIKEKENQYVFNEFHEVGFPIENFPELFERLIELSNMPDSHFDDAVKMTKIIEVFWQDIEKEVSFPLQDLKLACLFHDIGKSGPVEADKKQRKIIINQIFNSEHFNAKNPAFKDKKPKDLSISEALELENFSNKKEIEEYLETLTLHIFDRQTKKTRAEKLDIKRHKLIDLWREHDFWTYQLLKKYKDEKISQDLIIASSSHHTLEGYDPAEIDGNLPNEAVTLELLDKYLIVTLVDKYQAWVDRSGKTHNDAISELQRVIEASKADGIINHDDKVFNQFMKYLKILNKHAEIFEMLKK